MNKQGDKDNPTGGIEWTHILGKLTGYTENPVRGCEHECKWRMPEEPGRGSATVVICYAKAVATRLAQKAYPHGFEHVSFHPEALQSIRDHTKPAGIFIDSMSDLFGRNVQDEWIQQTLAMMRDCPQHRFFSLTKNPTRLQKFSPFPPNLLLGVSMPPTFMFGKELTPAQQRAWFNKALECLAACEAAVRWVSLEPLSWDCSDILAKFRDKLHWAVIGAGSDGQRTFQPDYKTYSNVMAALDGLPIFFKGNLRGMKFEPGAWRAEFPKI